MTNLTIIKEGKWSVTGFNYGHIDGQIVYFTEGEVYKNLRVKSQDGWETGCREYDEVVLSHHLCVSHTDGSPQQCGHTSFTPVGCIHTIQRCPDCGEFLMAYSFEYASRHPQAMESAMEQTLREHQSGRCPESSGHDHVAICSLCGEEIGRWDGNYCYNNPTGLDVAIEQAREDHELHYCQVVWQENWDTWRKDSGALKDETPRALLNRLKEDDRWEELYKTPTPPDRTDEQWEEEIEAVVAK